ncbi:MAG: ABC transporter permease, partial [Oscillospiraceae bacterium]|nr:ABC transporter permease [Oscillospiraceae bacterium]
VLCIQYITPMISFAKNIKKNLQFMELIRKHEIISYFGGATTEDSYYYAPSVMTMLMVLFGMLTALSLFSFAFNKKSVNVYFSMGIKRTRLFVNRIAAGAIELFAASVIPFFIVFIINVSLFGYNPQQLKLFAYYTFLLFTSGLAGLVIGAFAASISGSRIEMILTSASTSGIVMTAVALLSSLKSIFLRGYVSGDSEISSKILLLSPWTGLTEKENVNMLITGKKVPEALLITWKANVFPIVFWIIASIVIFALGLLLFKKRKNENSNSFGKFDVSSAINGAVIFFISAIVLTSLLESLYSDGYLNLPVCVILCVLGTFLIFFIAELIIRRNIKAVVRMFTVYGGLLIVSIGAVIVIGTGYFGTYNKLPEVKDIEFVSMSYSDPLNVFNYNTSYYKTEAYNNEKNTNVCKSTDAEDIKLCIEEFNKIKDDKRLQTGAIDYVSFVIKTKDGQFISRRFPVYSEDILHDYNKAVFNSAYFHKILKLSLDNSAANETEENTDYNGLLEYVGDVGYDKYQGISEFNYLNGSLLSDNFNYYEYSFDDENYYTLTNELRDALYNDLCKMTYDEYYGNNTEPIGAMAFSTQSLMLETDTYNSEYGWLDFNSYYGFDSYDADEVKKAVVKTGVAYDAILIYPQMTETIKQLKDVEPNPHNTAVKAVIYPDQKLSLMCAVDSIRGYKSHYGNIDVFMSGVPIDYWLSDNNAIKIFAGKPLGTYLDFLEIVYNESGAKLTRVDNADKANEIAKASRAVYDTYNDNGRYIFVIYEDGCVVSKYLPEKSTSVLG